MVEQVWMCGLCSGTHECEGEAVMCCSPEPQEAWACGDCEEVHKQKDEAVGCCGEKVSCPKCMRPHSEKTLNGVSVRVVGFCNICTPVYSYEEQRSVEDAFYAGNGINCNVLTGSVY